MKNTFVCLFFIAFSFSHAFASERMGKGLKRSHEQTDECQRPQKRRAFAPIPAGRPPIVAEFCIDSDPNNAFSTMGTYENSLRKKEKKTGSPLVRCSLVAEGKIHGAWTTTIYQPQETPPVVQYPIDDVVLDFNANHEEASPYNDVEGEDDGDHPVRLPSIRSVLPAFFAPVFLGNSH